MDIFAFIEKLQKKPESFRKKILAAALFVIMFIIVAVWFTTLRLSFGSDQGAKKIDAPSSFIKEDILSFYGFIKENIKRIR